jgi:hypothetical protein
MLTIIKPFQKTFAFSYTESLFWIRFFLFRVRVFKSQVRVFLNTSQDFFRVGVRVFLESGFSYSPSFEVCSVSGIKDGFYIVLYWLFGTPILAGFDRVMYGRQCGQSRFLDVGCLMTQTREHLNSVLSKSVLLNTARSARERVRTPGNIQDSIILFFINIMPRRDSKRIVHWFMLSCISSGVLTRSRALPGVLGRSGQYLVGPDVACFILKNFD